MSTKGDANPAPVDFSANGSKPKLGILGRALKSMNDAEEDAIRKKNEMADQFQLSVLKEGKEVWNNWRKDNPKASVNLQGADLRRLNLAGANLQGVNLCDACLNGTNLQQVNLDSARVVGTELHYANLERSSLKNAYFQKSNFSNANLAGSNLSDSYVMDAIFDNACLSGANLCRTIFPGTSFDSADLSGADLADSNLKGVNLHLAILNKANLSGADLSNSFLIDTKIQEANLSEVNLHAAHCYRTDFSFSNLTKVNLRNAILVETHLEQTVLTGSSIYGLSAWSLKGSPSEQSNLIITPDLEAEITVDDLKLGQFIYLLLNNKNVRNLIDTITSKAVLILGRFTEERKSVLDQIRHELSKYGYVAILFDFSNTQNQSLLETVMTLAGMSRFIIADVTNATMVREEIRSVVEKFPSKPIQPIILKGEKEFVTLPEMTTSFKSVLKLYEYNDKHDVVSNMKLNIIDPAEAWIESKKSLLAGGYQTIREMELQKENESLRKTINEISSSKSKNELSLSARIIKGLKNL